MKRWLRSSPDTASEQLKIRVPWGTVLALALRFLMLLIAAAGLLQCLIGIYALSIPTKPLLQMLLAMAAMIFLALVLTRRGLWFSLLAVGFGVFVVRHAELMVQGFLLLLEQALASMDLMLPRGMLAVLQSAEIASEQEALLHAVRGLLAIMLALLSCCTIVGTSAIGVLSLALPLLLPGLAAGLEPPSVPMFFLLFLCLMLAAYRVSLRTAEVSEAEDADLAGSEERVQRGVWAAAALSVIPVGLLTLLLSVCLLPRTDYAHPAYAKQLRQAFLDMDFSELFSGANDGLSRGDLTTLSDIRFTGDTALLVRVSEQRQLYLAGYTAAIFTGTNWENPPQSEYRRAAVNFSEPSPQNLHAAISDAESYEIFVRHADAANDVRYLPNGLMTPVGTIDGAMLLQDGALGGAVDASLEHYHAAALPYAAVPQPIEQAGDLRSSYLAAATRAAEHADSAVQVSAAAYADYVSEIYTQLPDDTRQAAETLLSEYGLTLSVQNGSYDIAALCRSLREALRTECRYAYTPQPLPQDADFATWFLRDAKEGYCVHFATTAAVLLRALGVPTRYAEGYIVIRSDYEKPQDAEGYVPIEDTHAHAWAEVFDPVQLCWIPVEMTPSSRDGAEPTQTPEAPSAEPFGPSETPQAEPSAQPAEPTESPNLGELTEPTEQLSESTPQNTQGTDLLSEPDGAPVPQISPQSGRNGKGKFLSLLLLLLFAGMGAILLGRKRRLARLDEPDPDLAVLAAWKETERLLRFADCPARAVGQSAEDYADRLAADRPWLDAAQLLRLIRFSERAAFSQHGCGEQERVQTLRDYETLRASYLSALPAWKRVLYRLYIP